MIEQPIVNKFGIQILLQYPRALGLGRLVLERSNQNFEIWAKFKLELYHFIDQPFSTQFVFFVEILLGLEAHPYRILENLATALLKPFADPNRCLEASFEGGAENIDFLSLHRNLFLVLKVLLIQSPSCQISLVLSSST